MTRRPRLRSLLTAGVALTLAGLALVVGAPLPADAHGSTQRPASRVYACRFEQPDNPMCADAWAANAQALYDWMEVNIGDAAGRHTQLLPDGQLCSAGRSKYAAFDRPGPWPVTALQTDGAGRVELAYENTAPHATEYYRVYLTRAGFDARTDPLAWGDLELVHDSGRLDRSSLQRLSVALPSRDVPAVLYIVWQRSDSPEAFYACSDVTVDAGGGIPPTTTPPTTTPPTSGPSTSGPSTAPTTDLPTTVATDPPTTTGQPTSEATSTTGSTVAPTVVAVTSTTSLTSTGGAANEPAATASTDPGTPAPTGQTTGPESTSGDESAAPVSPSTPSSAQPADTSPAAAASLASDDPTPDSPTEVAAAPSAAIGTPGDPAGPVTRSSTGSRSSLVAVAGSLTMVALGLGARWLAGGGRTLGTMTAGAGQRASRSRMAS